MLEQPEPGVFAGFGDREKRRTLGQSEVIAAAVDQRVAFERASHDRINAEAGESVNARLATGINDQLHCVGKLKNVETCSSASTFKGAFQRRRCLVPASAWYEWTGEAGAKTKHGFARADGRAIWFAGLWDRCTTSDAGEIFSFTILTGPSAGWLRDYHDRAPVILEAAEWGTWLDPAADAQGLLEAVRPERFQLKAAA